MNQRAGGGVRPMLSYEHMRGTPHPDADYEPSISGCTVLYQVIHDGVSVAV